jgi:hypothetical protein
MNTGSNERGSNEEMALSEIGQVGTQFDGFAHQTHRYSHYNCFKTEAIAQRGLFTKLGVQNAGAFITRGVLIDVAGSKGVEMAKRGEARSALSAGGRVSSPARSQGSARPRRPCSASHAPCW